MRPVLGVAVTCFPVYLRNNTRTVDHSIVALCKRMKDPGAGKWSLPGGKVENSERLLDGAQREFKEELGILVECLGVHPTIPAFCMTEAVYPPDFHYAIAHVLALAPLGGCSLPVLRAGSDAAEVCWVRVGKKGGGAEEDYADSASPFNGLALPYLSDLELVGPAESVVALGREAVRKVVLA